MAIISLDSVLTCIVYLVYTIEIYMHRQRLSQKKFASFRFGGCVEFGCILCGMVANWLERLACKYTESMGSSLVTDSYCVGTLS